MALHKIPIISGGDRMLQKSMWFLACLACLFASAAAAAAQSGTGATSREIDSDLSHVAGPHSRVANGRYARQVYRIGYEINDAYSDYLAMGAPSQLTPQQVRYLKEKNSRAATAVDTVTVTEGIIRHELPLRTNDVYLVLLTKIVD